MLPSRQPHMTRRRASPLDFVSAQFRDLVYANADRAFLSLTTVIFHRRMQPYRTAPSCGPDFILRLHRRTQQPQQLLSHKRHKRQISSSTSMNLYRNTSGSKRLGSIGSCHQWAKSGLEPEVFASRVCIAGPWPTTRDGNVWVRDRFTADSARHRHR